MIGTGMSEWTAAPQNAMWYGEVIFSWRGETDYNYGYSDSVDEPDPLPLAPANTAVLESKVLPCPSNPLYVEESDFEQ